MSDEMIYSTKEADYITEHQEIPSGERTLSEWILWLFCVNAKIPINGMARLMNEAFLMYHEITTKRIEQYHTDLYVLFEKNGFGVYSKEVEDAIKDLMFINELAVNINAVDKLESKDDIKISVTQKGIKRIKDFNDGFFYQKTNELKKMRTEWEKLTIIELVQQVHISYPHYLLFRTTKADEWYLKGETLLDTDALPTIDYNEAIMFFNKALAISPDHEVAWNRKGVSLFMLKKFDQSLICLQKALEINHRYVNAWYNRGLLFYNQREYEEAIKSYDRALEIDPTYVNALIHKGIALDKLQKYDEAIQSYDRALEIDPLSLNTWIHRGIALDKLQKYDEAIVSYNRALELDPNYSDAWFNKGKSLRNSGRNEDAMASFEKARALNPRHDDTSSEMARSMLRENKINHVLKKIEFKGPEYLNNAKKIRRLFRKRDDDKAFTKLIED